MIEKDSEAIWYFVLGENYSYRLALWKIIQDLLMVLNNMGVSGVMTVLRYKF